MMWRAAPRCMWRVREGFPCHSWGSGGPPREFFCKYKLWEGHFKANLKATGKKAKKVFFLLKLGKKVFASKKKVNKCLKGFPRGACNSIEMCSQYISIGAYNGLALESQQDLRLNFFLNTHHVQFHYRHWKISINLFLFLFLSVGQLIVAYWYLWHHRTRLTLVQLMAHSMMAPSHYL